MIMQDEKTVRREHAAAELALTTMVRALPVMETETPREVLQGPLAGRITALQQILREEFRSLTGDLDRITVALSSAGVLRAAGPAASVTELAEQYARLADGLLRLLWERDPSGKWGPTDPETGAPMDAAVDDLLAAVADRMHPLVEGAAAPWWAEYARTLRSQLIDEIGRNLAGEGPGLVPSPCTPGRVLPILYVRRDEQTVREMEKRPDPADGGHVEADTVRRRLRAITDRLHDVLREHADVPATATAEELLEELAAQLGELRTRREHAPQTSSWGVDQRLREMLAEHTGAERVDHDVSIDEVVVGIGLGLAEARTLRAEATRLRSQRDDARARVRELTDDRATQQHQRLRASVKDLAKRIDGSVVDVGGALAVLNDVVVKRSEAERYRRDLAHRFAADPGEAWPKLLDTAEHALRRSLALGDLRDTIMNGLGEFVARELPGQLTHVVETARATRVPVDSEVVEALDDVLRAVSERGGRRHDLQNLVQVLGDRLGVMPGEYLDPAMLRTKLVDQLAELAEVAGFRRRGRATLPMLIDAVRRDRREVERRWERAAVAVATPEEIAALRPGSVLRSLGTPGFGNRPVAAIAMTTTPNRWAQQWNPAWLSDAELVDFGGSAGWTVLYDAPEEEPAESVPQVGDVVTTAEQLGQLPPGSALQSLSGVISAVSTTFALRWSVTEPGEQTVHTNDASLLGRSPQGWTVLHVGARS